MQKIDPGNCLICGMALESCSVAIEDERENAEPKDMSRRFWSRAICGESRALRLRIVEI